VYTWVEPSDLIAITSIGVVGAFTTGIVTGTPVPRVTFPVVLKEISTEPAASVTVKLVVPDFAGTTPEVVPFEGVEIVIVGAALKPPVASEVIVSPAGIVRTGTPAGVAGVTAAVVVATPVAATVAATGVGLESTELEELLSPPPQPPTINIPANNPTVPNILKNLFILYTSW
jgi:hypothetical protein